MRGSRKRSSGAVLATTVLLVACGAAGSTADQAEAGILRDYNAKACFRMAHCGLTSSQMVFTMSPSSGPRGTLVNLRVSGCIDPGGRSHQLAYRVDSQPVVVIPATTRGTSLTAALRIAGPIESISAQCLDTVVTRTFMVTG